MATEEQHLAQSERNVEVAERLSASGDYDWAVTALFYASLHLMQAYFVRSGVDVQTHVQRERQALNRLELCDALDPYRTLRNHSEQARYQCRGFSSQEFASIYGGTFAIVSSHMRSLLGVGP